MAEHWCDIHKTKFFKTDKMSGYAHPVKDAGGATTAWCNEDAQEVAKLSPQPSDKVLPKHQEEIDKARASVTKKTREQEIAEHVWWKELGSMIRAGDIDMTKPAGKAMRTAYYAQMLSVLPITIKDKED